MSNKCVHEWYYRTVDIASWQFFCIRCGEKLSLNNFADHASDLEKNANALTARIAELEAENDRLQAAWFAEETICPDGSLKPKVSTLLSRIAELEAEIDEFLFASSNVLNPYDGISVPYEALKKLVKRVRKERER